MKFTLLDIKDFQTLFLIRSRRLCPVKHTILLESREGQGTNKNMNVCN